MSAVLSTDARTGEVGEVGASDTDPDQVAALTAAAAAASPWLQRQGRIGRATLLDRIAARIEDASEEIVAAADKETALGTPRLAGELTRTAFQLRFLGEVIRDGGYLDIVIDHATPTTPMGPRPDLRRTLYPLGPVGVFGASNFPLAFSVAGGDSASALAAGCPVVAKAHPAHPATSLLVAAAINEAVGDCGGPSGVFGMVFGVEAGTALVTDPRITAIGFTGSLRGGRALYDAACSRPEPIPFYGELGSVNPLVVSPAAASARGEEIGRGAAASVLLGQGQFCTKPGLLAVPAGTAGDAVTGGLAAAVHDSTPGHLLTSSIAATFHDESTALMAADGITTLASTEGQGTAPGALVVEVSAESLLAGDAESLLDEHFGPFAVVVRYEDAREVAAVLAALPPALTGTVHGVRDGTDPDLGPLLDMLSARSGRVIVNGYPTGVAVSWAMHHGGPYPATTAPGDTSVGASAVRRWLRPVTFQDTPQELLPAELRDNPAPGFPRRVDGVLVLPGNEESDTDMGARA